MIILSLQDWMRERLFNFDLIQMSSEKIGSGGFGVVYRADVKDR